jgi:succinoglycan biosynthesis transport protein ExoP
MRTQYVELVSREAEEARVLGPRHPTLIELRAQIRRLRGLIEGESSRPVEAARNDYLRARGSEQTLARRLAELKENAVLTAETGTRIRELESEVQASRAAYEAFLVRAQDAGRPDGSAAAMRIVSKAELPLDHSWPPSSLLVMLAATILGASAGTGLACMRGSTLPSGAPGRTELPTVAMLPRNFSKDPLAAFENPQSKAATELRKLHDLLRGGRQWDGQSILLIGLGDSAEATAVGINVAMLAAANKRTLIDADVRGRACAALKRERSQHGLLDVAAGGISLSQAVMHDANTNIHLLALAGANAQGYANIKDEAITAAFAQSRSFDLVVITAVLDGSNPIAPFFARVVNQILLVGKNRAMRKRSTAEMISRLAEDARDVRGVVLTDAY